MSEQTNPEPVDSGAVASEGAASVESPEPSGAETETSEAVASENSSAAPMEEPTENVDPVASALAAFDPDAWDGNIDSLPQELQGPAQHIQKNLEGGYTKKFQTLAEERKTFDEANATWGKEKQEWESTRDDIITERDLLKQMMDGAEDPRLGNMTKKYETSSTELSKMKADFEEFRRLVEEDIDSQAEDYAQKFYEEHKEIFENEETHAQLDKLLDDEWEPVLAIQLINQSEETLNLAKELREQGTPQKVAIEHALLKGGGKMKKRDPRPGAKLTSGAEATNNPASSQAYTDFGTNSNDARRAAAQAAVNWRNRKSLT